MPRDFTIRPATDSAADREAMLRFIYELNVFESGFEPNRRLDQDFPQAMLDWRLSHVRDQQGAVFLAVGLAGEPIGWTVVLVENVPPYIHDRARVFGNVAELYVEADWRGRGVGRALVKAATEHAKAKGAAHIMIGVLTRNREALAAYETMGFRPYALEMLRAID